MSSLIFLMTDAFSQEKMSSGGIQLSLDILNLNHNILQLAGQQRWPVTVHLLLASSSTPPTCSKANKRLFPPLPPPTCDSCLCLPTIPRAVSIFHTDCAGKPLQPTSSGNSQAYHPLSLSSRTMALSSIWTRSWHLVAFLGLNFILYHVAKSSSAFRIHLACIWDEVIMVRSSIKPLIGGWRVPDSIIGPLDSFPITVNRRFIPMIS